MFIKSLFCGALFTALAFSQERDLNRGRGELRAFAGVSFGSNSGSMDSVAPTVGTEVAFGITRVLAVTGSYANNSLRLYSARRHEVMGGVRISAANRSRVTPYGALTAGAVMASAAGQSGMMGGSAGMIGPATNTGRTPPQSLGRFPGRRHRRKIGRNVGVLLDFRAVKAIDLGWYGRTAVVFFRWN